MQRNPKKSHHIQSSEKPIYTNINSLSITRTQLTLFKSRASQVFYLTMADRTTFLQMSILLLAIYFKPTQSTPEGHLYKSKLGLNWKQHVSIYITLESNTLSSHNTLLSLQVFESLFNDERIQCPTSSPNWSNYRRLYFRKDKPKGWSFVIEFCMCSAFVPKIHGAPCHALQLLV